jgi:hypothetical protein
MFRFLMGVKSWIAQIGLATAANVISILGIVAWSPLFLFPNVFFVHQKLSEN